MKKHRILKIHNKFQLRAWNTSTIVPEIRLEGKWLEELGFKSGNKVVIEQQQHKLIITLQK